MYYSLQIGTPGEAYHQSFSLAHPIPICGQYRLSVCLPIAGDIKLSSPKIGIVPNLFYTTMYTSHIDVMLNYPSFREDRKGE